LERLAESEVLVDYMGADYIRAYVACKTKELDTFENHIGRHEYEWYLLAE